MQDLLAIMLVNLKLAPNLKKVFKTNDGEHKPKVIKSCKVPKNKD